MAPKSVTFRRHDHLVTVLFGDLLSHSYNITFSMFLYLVLHCLYRKASSCKFDDSDVTAMDTDGMFEVKSGDNTYSVKFNERSCSCPDWIQTNYPCKHCLLCFAPFLNGVGMHYQETTFPVHVLVLIHKHLRNILTLVKLKIAHQLQP